MPDSSTSHHPPPPHRRGRGHPTKLTPEIHDAICQAVGKGMPIDRAAELVDVDAHTVWQWLRRGEGRDIREASPLYVNFANAIKRMRAVDQQRRLERISKAAEGGAVVKRKITRKVDGSEIIEEVVAEPQWTADAWVLERRDLARYARTAEDRAKAAEQEAAKTGSRDGISGDHALDADARPWAAKREACRWDVEKFAQTFFDHLLRDPLSEMHRDFFAVWRADRETRGLHSATAAPRGHAKTTIMALIKIVHDCVYAHERFIVVAMNTQSLAERRVTEIRDELERNDLLKACFGEQRGPIWNKGDFVTAQGVRVTAVSPGSQVRGMLHQGVRPTKMVGDDIESSIHVQTELQREKLSRWWNDDFMKLGSPHTNVDVIGTVMAPESLLSTLLNTPGYRTRRYQAVIHFATNTARWQEWRGIFTNLENEHHLEDAWLFYEAHRREMDEGAEVLWPEHESYYDLMVMRIMEGEVAFQLEKQNRPTPSALYIFEMDRAGYCQVEPQGILRGDGRRIGHTDYAEIAAYWDPATGNSQESDWSSCPVVVRDRQGYLYVVDLYLSQLAKPSAQVEGIVDLLWRWRPGTFGLEVNGFQSLLVEDVKSKLAERGVAEGEAWMPEFVPVTNTRAKPVRISTLEPLVANRWLWFNDSLPREAFRQFREFRAIAHAGKDDVPDSVEGAVRVIKHLAWSVGR